MNLIPRLPGYVGNGYDIYLGNPKANKIDPGFRSPVFDIKYSEGLKTEDLQFLIPDRMKSILRFSCLHTSTVIEYTGTKKYQDGLKNLVFITGDKTNISAASFSGSPDFKLVQQATSITSSLFTESTAKCEAYSLEMPIFDYLPLNPDFVAAVLKAQLSGLEEDWIKVIEVYGTHFVYKTILGGRLHLKYEINNQNYQELTYLNVDIKEATKREFSKFTKTNTEKNESDSSILELFEKRVDDTKEVYIGGKHFILL